jgi:predicted DNA-binding transcriptional regulator YafY
MTRPKDTEAIRRGFNILSMVSRAPLSIKDVHSRLKQSGILVSKRTIEKDLKRLPEEFPQMIEVDDTSKPYTFRQPRNARKYSGMSPEEAVCLELAYTYLNPLLPNTSLNDIRPYLKEAEAVLSEHASTKMRRWKDKVETINEGFQLKQAQIKEGILENIHKSIWDGRTIIAKYKSARSPNPKDYLLHPAGIVNRGRICYLICSFDERPNVTYLPLHRFYKINIVQEQPSRHINSKVTDLTKNLLGFKVENKNINIKLKFSKIAGFHLYETPISNSQKISQSKDGYIIVEDSVANNSELRWWIRAFGDDVEVIKPIVLRSEFKKISQRMAKLYE